jgi:hypothetical protein
MQLTARASARGLAAFPILLAVTIASRVAVTVYALNMRPLGELRDHKRVISLKIAVLESS